MVRKIIIGIMVLVFLAGLGFFLYPYAQGALIDREIQENAEDFHSRVEVQPTTGNTSTVKGIKQIGNQYYRLFTAGLTHTHILHMLANVCAMFWIGYLYEQRLGSVKFLLVGMICAIVCQVVFLAICSNTTESFGGSGYNFALIGFGLALQYLTPDFPKIAFGTWSGNWLIIYLILGNIPVLSFMNVTTVIFHAIAFVLGMGAAFVFRMLSM